MTAALSSPLPRGACRDSHHPTVLVALRGSQDASNGNGGLA